MDRNQKRISKEDFAKEVGCDVDKLDAHLLVLAEKGYIRIFDYDKHGNPLEFNLNAETKKEAKKILEEFDKYEL